jgi:serine/threonine protein kinase
MATNEQGYSDFKDFICFLEEQYIGSKSLSDLDLDTKPPEMFWKKYQCEPYHPQALDVWALGVLTMKLMTGGYNYLTVDFNANKVMMELSPWFHLLRDNPEQFSLTFSASVHNADHDLIRLMTHMLCPYPANRIDVKNLFESIHK